MNIQKYLDRIKYNSEVKISKEVLFGLQRNHILNIPFENLDIHYGIKIELDIDKIFHKIIFKKRGGFCYELNSIFHELLKAIGFNANLISGRVIKENNDYGQDFDHMAIIVELESKVFLVDVGFGKFFQEPIEIVLERIQQDAYGAFIIDRFDDSYFRVSKLENCEKIPEYIFNLNKRKLSEFEKMCNFHQTNSESHFTKSKVISIAKINGRITLTNNNLKITENDEIIIIVFDEPKFDYYLNKYFDVQIEKTTNS